MDGKKISQNKITLIGFASFLWLNGVYISAQPNRGVGVKVKNQQTGNTANQQTVVRGKDDKPVYRLEPEHI